VREDASGVTRVVYSADVPIFALAVRGGDLLVGELGRIVRVALSSGDRSVLVLARRPSAMAVNGSFVLWVDPRGTNDLIRREGVVGMTKLPE
jgi:hypothetical protein